MRFLLDENESPAILSPLHFIYPQHEFEYSSDVFGKGVLDLDLIPQMRKAGFDCLITRDGNQLQIDDERQALVQHGIHWIGHKKPPGKGAQMISNLTATYVAAFPHIIGALRNSTESRSIRVYNFPSTANKWVKVRNIDPFRYVPM